MEFRGELTLYNEEKNSPFPFTNYRNLNVFILGDLHGGDLKKIKLGGHNVAKTTVELRFREVNSITPSHTAGGRR